MTVCDRLFLAYLQRNLGHLLDDEESNDEEVAALSEGIRINSSSVQDLNSFESPMIHLFKTNSEGRKAQLDILPEDFQPNKSRLPYPIIGPLGLTNLDVESTSEMLMKMSISGLIKTDPNIDLERLINHLNGFTYRSHAVNP